ncbi:MAG: glycosyltransferase family 9 protein [Ktedonobacteraceae bacterium]
MLKSLLRAIILLLVRLYGIPRARAAARKARASTPVASRILLIRPDHLGDMVLTTPVLRALKQQAPDAHITMMVGSWSSEIVARHPAIDRLLVLPFPGFRRASQNPLAPYILLANAAKQLRRGNFDLAVNLRPDFWWGAALVYLAAIPRRVGYALQPGTPFLSRAISFQMPELATISNLRLASAGLQLLGCAPLPEPYRPEIYPLDFRASKEEQQQMADRLRSASIDEQAPVIVIHPGTGGAVKLWRNEAWSFCTAEVTRLVSAHLTKSTSARIILTGSKNERPMLEEIASGMTTPALIISDFTVGQLAALLGRASLVLGVDNGPLHMAVAQGTPTVGIFGPTDPRIFGPWGNPEQHIVVASTHRCPSCPAIPCGRLDFTPDELPVHPCVRMVTEQEVLAAVERLLPRVKHNVDAGRKAL